MIRRQNRTIFLDAKESTSVAEIKRQLEGITKYSVEEQLLLKDDITLRNDKQLRDYNITKSTAPSHSPVTLGLCLMGPYACTANVLLYSNPLYFTENGHFETLNVTPY